MSETVAVIPARGGSKGIPGKNLQRVGGIPLVARAVRSALAADGIDRVVVSTDDEEIAAVAREWGAQVVRRPAELAGDRAASESALEHVLDSLAADGVEVGVLAFLQATSPFIDPRDLAGAVAAVAGGASDVVFSAVETYGFLWAPDATGDAHGVNHDRAVRPRRQDRDPHYLETGAFYVIDAAGFRATGHRFFGRVGMQAVAERSAIEIDDHEQLTLARTLVPLFDGSLSSGASSGSALAPIDVDAVVTDFDGVHTDDTATVDAEGREQVRVSRSDGWGVAALRRAGIPVFILSTEKNPVVAARAAKLGVEVSHGVDDKLPVLREWAVARGIPLSRIAYVGNDAGDLACLAAVGWPIAVADAHPLALAEARAITTRRGGAGAVREVAERVLAARTGASRRNSHTEPAPGRATS